MTSESVIVVVYGGCVNDVLGVSQYDVFDWDNFNDNPIAYVEENGGLDGEYFQIIREHSKELYNEIATALQAAKNAEESERRKDPFCDVPDNTR